MAWAAGWLYKATAEESYLKHAHAFLAESRKEETDRWDPNPCSPVCKFGRPIWSISAGLVDILLSTVARDIVCQAVETFFSSEE